MGGFFRQIQWHEPRASTPSGGNQKGTGRGQKVAKWNFVAAEI
jgi:hypothetical protein